MAVLNVTKYPPSLDYLLLTLGVTFLLLATIDRAGSWIASVLATYGRVPLFIYVIHLYAAWLMSWIIDLFQRNTFKSVGGIGPIDAPPETLGLSLPGTYVAWALLMALLFPACRWFARVKQRPSAIPRVLSRRFRPRARRLAPDRVDRSRRAVAAAAHRGHVQHRVPRSLGQSLRERDRRGASMTQPSPPQPFGFAAQSLPSCAIPIGSFKDHQRP